MIHHLDNLLRHLFLAQIAELASADQVGFQPPDEDWRGHVTNLQRNALNIYLMDQRQNLDDAFMRRLAFTVHFPFPDEASHRRLWAGIWPAATPLAANVDLDCLARQFKLSGGNIKNIALAAAFLAADDGGRVTMAHLLQTTRREYQKMGKTLSESQLDGVKQEPRGAARLAR
jgi:hypothetical protein